MALGLGDQGPRSPTEHRHLRRPAWASSPTRPPCPAPPGAGQSVSRIQHVGGVDFSYQPPPRNIVPYAASLKGQGAR